MIPNRGAMPVQAADSAPPVRPDPFATTAAVAGSAAALIGAVILFGWFADFPQLTDWFGRGISTLPNTAACAVISGTGLVCLSWRRRRTALALGLCAALAGLLVIVEHIGSVNLGIDRILLVRDWGQRATVAPGRMGPPAAVAFAVAGFSIAYLSRRPRGTTPAAVGGLILLAIALLSIVGYLYGVNPLYAVPRYTAIAGPTSLIVLALGVGVFASSADGEVRHVLLGSSSAAVSARRLLPLAILLPVGIGWVRVLLERAGIFESSFGTAVRTLTEAVLFTSVLWAAMRALSRHEDALRDSHTQLERQRTQLSAFLETAALGIHRAGPDGTILWANDAELALLGYSRDEYVGRNLAEFYPPALVADMLARLRRGERVTDVETVLRCRDGSLKSVLIDCTALLENGNFLHTQSFTRDITGRRAAEAATTRLAAIVESSDDAIVSKTLDGIITSWNRGAEKIFGYSEAEALGKPITLVIPTDRLGEEENTLRRLRRGERIDHFETVRRTKDGRLIDISLTVSPLRDSSGRVTGASKVARDVTDRKRTEAALLASTRELERYKQELEQRVEERTRELLSAHERLRLADRMAAVGTLASGLAHDIKNVTLPLGTRLDAILTTPGLSKTTTQDFAVVCALLDHLRSMADNLSLFAKDPDQEGTEGRTQLSRWSARVRGFIDASAGPSVFIRWDIPPGLPDVAVAPHRLTQAVLNLVHNARDAILAHAPPPSGRPTAAGNITVEAHALDAGAVALSVRDDGCGMTAEVLRRCMEPFFTTKDRPTIAGASGGTGLGLSLAHAIAERSGGGMDIESAPGAGTTITLRLPPAAPGTAIVEPKPIANRARVTIADPRRRAIYLHVLRSLGYLAQDHPASGEPDELAASLWISDEQNLTPADARNFLDLAPGRRIVLVTAPEPQAPTSTPTPPTATASFENPSTSPDSADDWPTKGLHRCPADASISRIRAVVAGAQPSPIDARQTQQGK